MKLSGKEITLNFSVTSLTHTMLEYCKTNFLIFPEGISLFPIKFFTENPKCNKVFN